MGQDIQCNNVNFPGRAAASAVRLGSHAARGDYGGCDSARVAQPGSHAARGVRGGRSSASTMRVVIIARLARCADAALCAASGLIMKVSRRRGQYTLLKCSCLMLFKNCCCCCFHFHCSMILSGRPVTMPRSWTYTRPSS